MTVLAIGNGMMLTLTT